MTINNNNKSSSYELFAFKVVFRAQNVFRKQTFHCGVKWFKTIEHSTKGH